MKTTTLTQIGLFILVAHTLFVTDIQAATQKPRWVARVIMVKGDVTKLEPGNREATAVKRGDKLIEDTSLVTKEKSIAVIIFRDKTRINLSPKGKLRIVEKKREGPGVIGLLNGHIRTKVIKNRRSKQKDKLYIKTRTAAMGVRGTEFETIFNPENEITSLITLEGKVKMAKIDPKKATPPKRKKAQPKKKNKKKEIVREKTNSLGANDLAKVLQKKEAVEVRAGRYAGVVPTKKKVSKPVRVSPFQYLALRNKTKKGKKFKDVKYKKYKDEAPPEGIKENKKTGDYAPRSGGYVDLNTGLYIPPPKKSAFDKKRKVYIPPQSFGGVSKKSGNYVPPKGTKLDALKGFVLDEKKIEENSLEKNAELVAQLNLINNDIKTDILTPLLEAKKKENKEIFPQEIIDEPDRFKAHTTLAYNWRQLHVYELYGEIIQVTYQPTSFFDIDQNLEFSTDPRKTWVFRPDLNIYGRYHTRRKQESSWRDNQLNISGRLMGVYGHKINFFPAEFSFGIVGLSGNRSFGNKKKLTHFNDDMGIQFSESFHLNLKNTLRFTFDARDYKGRQTDNRGEIFRFSAEFERNMSRKEKLRVDLGLTQKSSSVDIFDRKMLGLNSYYQRDQLIKDYFVGIGVNLAAVDRKEGKNTFDETRFNPYVNFIRSYDKQTQGVITAGFETQSSDYGDDYDYTRYYFNYSIKMDY